MAKKNGKPRNWNFLELKKTELDHSHRKIPAAAPGVPKKTDFGKKTEN